MMFLSVDWHGLKFHAWAFIDGVTRQFLKLGHTYSLSFCGHFFTGLFCIKSPCVSSAAGKNKVGMFNCHCSGKGSCENFIGSEKILDDPKFCSENQELVCCVKFSPRLVFARPFFRRSHYDCHFKAVLVLICHAWDSLLTASRLLL